MSTTTVFTLHLFKIMVLLLYNFFLLNNIEEKLENLIEFHNKDETLLALVIQEN